MVYLSGIMPPVTNIVLDLFVKLFNQVLTSTPQSLETTTIAAFAIGFNIGAITILIFTAYIHSTNN